MPHRLLANMDELATLINLESGLCLRYFTDRHEALWGAAIAYSRGGVGVDDPDRHRQERNTTRAEPIERGWRVSRRALREGWPKVTPPLPRAVQRGLAGSS
jgi:hypothetical protein